MTNNNIKKEERTDEEVAVNAVASANDNNNNDDVEEMIDVDLGLKGNDEDNNNNEVTSTTSATTAQPKPRPTALAFSEHLGGSRQYWRDIILGVNDGLVSTFLLVAGVVGGGLSSTNILLTAISGALAGAVSMFAGEYVATKSQNEVMEGEIKLEAKHIDNYMNDEIDELNDTLLPLIGISDEQTDLKQTLCDYYRNHPESLLQIMIALEFGVIEREQRSPFMAGLTSCILFLLGSLPSVIPFIFSGDEQVMYGLVPAAVITTTCLLLVGAIKTWATRGNCLTASLENLIIAGCGGAFAYGVGVLFGELLN